MRKSMSADRLGLMHQMAGAASLPAPLSPNHPLHLSPAASDFAHIGAYLMGDHSLSGGHLEAAGTPFMPVLLQVHGYWQACMHAIMDSGMVTLSTQCGRLAASH